MPQPEDFPPMVFMGVDNRQGGRIASIRELAPMFHRPPDRVWAECYRMECDSTPAIDWYGADFAKCPVGAESPVIDAVREATAAADRRFVAYLGTVPPARASDVVEVEMISDQSVRADGPYLLPIGPPTQMY